MPGYIGPGKVQFFDNNGHPLVGGQVWVYIAGTTTLADCWDNWDDAVANTNPQDNPVTLNSRGEAIIIVRRSVKLQVESSDIDEGTGHGSIIWTLDDVAIADGLSTSSGGYHFLSNTIADVDDNVAFGFQAVTSPTGYVLISSVASNASPTITVVDSGVTDQSLTLLPQNNGSVKITNPTVSTGNTVTIKPSSNTTETTIISSGTGNHNMRLDTQGTGHLVLDAPTDVNGATVVTGTLTTSGATTLQSTLGVTGATTLSSTLVVSSGINAASIGLTNSGFTASLTAPTLAGNRSWSLPSADGTANQMLTTNGSGALSFTTPATIISYGVVEAWAVGPQGIPTGFTTNILLGTEILDVSGVFSSPTYTPLRAGYYRISCGAYMGVLWQLNLRKNGSDYGAAAAMPAGHASATWIVSMNGSTDSITCTATQNTGGNQDLFNGKFTAAFIGT